MSYKKSASLGAAISLVASLAIATLTATGASAADYRYWTFWTAGPVVQCSVAEGATEQSCEELPTATEWQFAQVGAQDIQLRDMSVLGWKFAISTPEGSEPPVEAPNFATLCPDMSNPVSDQFRVAVVIDFGATEIAPPGDTPPTPNKVGCVSVEVGQNAADALVLASSEVRADGGFVCGIDGYPTEECGAEVSASEAVAEEAATEEATTEVDVSEEAADEPTQPSSLPTWLWPLVGIAVIGALIAIIVGVRRGRAGR